MNVKLWNTSKEKHNERGMTLFGLLFIVIFIAFFVFVGLKVYPSVYEYFLINKNINRIASQGLSTVQEVREAFEKAKDIEFGIQSITGKDLEITKDNDKMKIIFAYDKEIELVSPVFLLIKYRGSSKSKI